MRKIFVLIVIILLGYVAYVRLKELGYIGKIGNPLPSAGTNVVLATPNPYLTNTKTPKEVPYKIEEFVNNLSVPWAIVFTSSNRMLVTERGGTVRGVLDGKLLLKPLISFGETAHSGEDGLLGMALDPNYDSNKYIYVNLSYGKAGGTYEKIIRLQDLGDSIIIDRVIFDDIPAAQFHDGGRIHFGPDGKLYISTGDALSKDSAQDKLSLSGKILRINNDGTIPADNPFSGSPVWSFGHRNPEGFDWYPESKVMMETEHGPSTFDGPPGGDEVNSIEAGENYGWPIAHHEIHKDGMIDPKIVFTPAFAPASGMFYKGKVFPQFYGNFFFGGLVGEGIMRVIVDAKDPSKILSYGKLENINFGRIREIAQGPDGYIYFSTSNKDGRGKPKENDDKIYRIVPQSKK